MQGCHDENAALFILFVTTKRVPFLYVRVVMRIYIYLGFNIQKKNRKFHVISILKKSNT